MLKLVDKLKHEKLHRIGPFLQPKEAELRKEIANKTPIQISTISPQIPLPPPKDNLPIVQTQQLKQTPIVLNNEKTMDEITKKLEK